MNISSIFRITRKDDVADAARQMAMRGVERRRAKIRARVDKMRSDMGLPQAEWPS